MLAASMTSVGKTLSVGYLHTVRRDYPDELVKLTLYLANDKCFFGTFPICGKFFKKSLPHPLGTPLAKFLLKDRFAGSDALQSSKKRHDGLCPALGTTVSDNA